MMALRAARLVVATLVAVAAVVLAWLFGLPELSVLAVALWACVTGAAAVHRWRRKLPRVDATAAPARVTRGTGATLQLEFSNPSGRRSAPARLHGRFATAGAATVGVAALGAGERAAVTVTLPTPARGLLRPGPLNLEYRDPLSIWRTGEPVPTEASVLGGSGPRPGAGSRTASVVGGAEADEDLVGLRPYVRGDDLRRIHWRTSARRDEPHVVQVEPPVLHVPVVVLLDTRPNCNTGEFERAVEVAASIAVAASDANRPVNLSTTAAAMGSGSPASLPFEGGSPLPEILDTLALVRPDGGVHPADVLRVPRSDATTVLCTGDATISGDGDLARMCDVVVCTSGIPAKGGDRQEQAPAPGAAVQIDWDGTASLAEVFARALDARDRVVGA